MTALHRSEGVPQAQEDPSVAAVGGPLIEEPGVGNACFGDAEVARIRQVEEIHAELKLVAFGKQPRRLRRRSNLRCRSRHRADICDPGCRSGHRRRMSVVPIRVQGRSVLKSSCRLPGEVPRWSCRRWIVGVEGLVGWITHQPSDTAKCCRWIRTVQYSKRCAALQREGLHPPASPQEAAERPA